MKTPILAAELAVPAASVAAVQHAMADIKAAGRVEGDVLLSSVDGEVDVHVQGGINAVSFELGEAPVKTPRN